MSLSSTRLTYHADRSSSTVPLPPYPPPDPLAYEVPNSPVILVFRKYLTQRRDETWVPKVIDSAFTDCAQHSQAEPLQNTVYTWNYKSVDLQVKPTPERGGPPLTWRYWRSALNGVLQFSQRYTMGREGLRMNFEILVQGRGRGVDAQFVVGKGVLDMI